MLAAFAFNGRAFTWLPKTWAIFWTIFFATLRAGLHFEALSLTKVLPLHAPAACAMDKKKAQQEVKGF